MTLTDEDRRKILLAQAFKNGKVKKSKTVPHFPEQFEREYKREAKAFLSEFEKTVEAHKTELAEALGTRQDADADESSKAVNGIFAQIAKELNVKIGRYALAAKIEKLALNTSKMTAREWERAIHKTLGVDLTKDFFRGNLYEKLLKQWTSDNVELITKIPLKSLDKMKGIVNRGWLQGKSTKSIIADITHEYSVSESHAEFLAVDQMGKLNAELTKMQQEAVGVKRYQWCTSKDAKVRTAHRKLHGRVFNWDNPPVVDEKTGRRCHPGQDYRCRCVALAVFDNDTFNVPLEAVDWDKVDNDTNKILHPDPAAEKAAKKSKKKIKRR